ncbi:MAG TPA: DNRLRE domain-containing protein [Chitinophagaceae bacterium]|jgi:hypothetical protein
MLKPAKYVLASLFLIVVGCSKSNTPPPPPPVPVNKIPVADAGLHQEITRPLDSTIVIGSGKDTDGVISSYAWTQVSGPTTSTIESPSSNTTNIVFKHSGTYIFQLLVKDDKGASASDTVSILVKPSGNDTLVSQPGNNPIEVHIWGNPSLDESWNGSTELNADTWTSNGQTVYVRAAFGFDLSSVPKSATILGATLSLYSSLTPQNGDLVHANAGPDNTMLVQEVTQSWIAANVHWNTQPSSTTTNQIVVPATNQSFLDLNLEVGAIVTDMTQNNNYGFLIKLQNEQPFNSRIFCSSYNADATKHPKLVVTYKFE